MKISLINKEYEWEELSILSKVVVGLLITLVLLCIIPIAIFCCLVIFIIFIIESIKERIC